MSQDPRPMPERVRVTGPPRRRTPADRTDAGAETRLDDIYLRSLVREQLRLAVGILAALALTVGILPLVFHMLPDLAVLHVLGLPLSWLVLGTLVYPVLVVLGWRYVRRAERNELHFAELISAAPEIRPAPGEDDG